MVAAKPGKRVEACLSRRPGGVLTGARSLCEAKRVCATAGERKEEKDG